MTDITELHFVEIPKLGDYSNEKYMLVIMTEFLENPEKSSLYDARVKILKDKISELNVAKRDGIEEVDKNLLDILDNETIALKIGLSIKEVEKLR